MARQSQETDGDSEKALLVCVENDATIEPYAVQELIALADTAGARVLEVFHQHRREPDPAFYIGRGKAEEIRDAETGAELMIVDTELSPTQQRNLQETTNLRVIDRTQLILDIFGQRARTREGKLQVELAQQMYLLPRLMNVYTKFERQQGGIGVRGGAGETKLETDRRKVRDHIGDLEEEIAEVRSQRRQQRNQRGSLPFPTAALVGYTSAGKSTLLNRLTGADVMADAKLFATLDPTTRRVSLPEGWAILLTDTVGFIRNLPHGLVAAFRATMEEVVEADFLIHVVDAAHPEAAVQERSVLSVLDELGAADKAMITVLNKADVAPDRFALTERVAATDNACTLSAKTGEGMQDLIDRIAHTLRSLLVPVRALLPYDKPNLLAQCYQSGRVLALDYRPEGIALRAELTRDLAGRLAPYATTIEAEAPVEG
jgi:GTP-binding protein HflX